MMPCDNINQNANESSINDKEILLEAIKKRGRVLKYASDSLKNDKEIILEAIKTDFWALKYASVTLKNNMQTTFTAIDFETAQAKRWSICQVGLVRVERVIVKVNLM